MPDSNQWESVSHLFSKRIPTNEYIIYPAVINQLGNVISQRVLDVGCGAGHLANKVRRMGAHVLGIDASEEMITLAQDQYPDIRFRQLAAKELFRLEETDFDAAMAVMVFLCMDQRESLEQSLAQICGKLKPGGRLIIADLHPAAKRNISTQIFSQSLPEGLYFKSGQPIEVALRNQSGEVMSFTDYNWSLEDFARAIRITDLVITDIKEPRPAPEVLLSHPDLSEFFDQPFFILIQLTKF